MVLQTLFYHFLHVSTTFAQLKFWYYFNVVTMPTFKKNNFEFQVCNFMFGFTMKQKIESC